MKEPDRITERPDSFWNKIYFAVIVSTFVIVTMLWAFSKYFS